MQVYPQYPSLSDQIIQNNIESFKVLKIMDKQLKSCLEKTAKMGHRFVSYDVTDSLELIIKTKCSADIRIDSADETHQYQKRSCKKEGRITLDMDKRSFKIKYIDLFHKESVCGVYTYRERPSN